MYYLLYRQAFGVAIGSPLGPSLANVYLAYHKQNGTDCRLLEYRPLYCQYVDDIFVLFKSSDHVKRFQICLISCHVNMLFNRETKQNKKISFLNDNVIHEQGKYTASIYGKATFSDVCTHFDSFLYDTKWVWFTQ